MQFTVYTCQQLSNFINAFACYKQKCKPAQFNLAHAVLYMASSFCGRSSVFCVSIVQAIIAKIN